MRKERKAKARVQLNLHCIGAFLSTNMVLNMLCFGSGFRRRFFLFGVVAACVLSSCQSNGFSAVSLSSNYLQRSNGEELEDGQPDKFIKFYTLEGGMCPYAGESDEVTKDISQFKSHIFVSDSSKDLDHIDRIGTSIRAS